jgi:hypothetical protein
MAATLSPAPEKFKVDYPDRVRRTIISVDEEHVRRLEQLLPDMLAAFDGPWAPADPPVRSRRVKPLW